MEGFKVSYDTIIPKVQELTESNQSLRCKFMSKLRDAVAHKCPKNKIGNPVISDYDTFVRATPEEWAAALEQTVEVKK